MKNFSRFLMSFVAVIAAMAAIIAIFYKITKKHLKINVEVLPDDIEDENELTAAVDVIDIDIPSDDTDSEIDVSFTEEDN